MNTNLEGLPADERIQLIENLSDSIVVDQSSLLLTEDQRTELDKRLQAYALDGKPGRLAGDVINGIRSTL